MTASMEKTLQVLVSWAGLASVAIAGTADATVGAATGPDDGNRYSSGFVQGERVIPNNGNTNPATLRGNPNPKLGDDIPATYIYKDSAGVQRTVTNLDPKQFIDMQDAALGGRLVRQVSTNTYKVLTKTEYDTLMTSQRSAYPNPNDYPWKDATLYSPPNNNVLVVDTEAWNKKTPAERAANVIFQTVVKTKITIVKTYTPVYQNVSVTAYPCCCAQTVSLLTRFDVKETTTVTTEILKIPQGADYPTDLVSVNREVVYKDGKPMYSTEIPQLCQFHYGPDVTFDKLFPTAPLITGADDKAPQVAESSSSSSNTTNNGTSSGNTYASTPNSSEYIVLPSGQEVWAGTTRTAGGDNLTTVQDIQVNGAYTSKKLADGSQSQGDLSIRPLVNDPTQPGAGLNRYGPSGNTAGDVTHVKKFVAISHHEDPADDQKNPQDPEGPGIASTEVVVEGDVPGQ